MSGIVLAFIVLAGATVFVIAGIRTDQRNRRRITRRGGDRP